jgi:hypothetical protein
MAKCTYTLIKENVLGVYPVEFWQETRLFSFKTFFRSVSPNPEMHNALLREKTRKSNLAAWRPS